MMDKWKSRADSFLLTAIVLIGAALNFSWVFFPALGEIGTAINGLVLGSAVSILLIRQLWQLLMRRDRR